MQSAVVAKDVFCISLFLEFVQNLMLIPLEFLITHKSRWLLITRTRHCSNNCLSWRLINQSRRGHWTMKPVLFTFLSFVRLFKGIFEHILRDIYRFCCKTWIEKCVSIIITSSIDWWGPRNHSQCGYLSFVVEGKVIKKLFKVSSSIRKSLWNLTNRHKIFMPNHKRISMFFKKGFITFFRPKGFLT